MTSAQCARCGRLELACLTVRPVRPAGRRTHHGSKSVSRMSGKVRKLEQDQGIDACLDALPDLQPEERELLIFLLNQSESLDQFVVCSKFQVEQQHSLAAQLPAALPLLKDAYLACAITLKQLQPGSATDIDSSACVRYISKAICALRSLPILSSQDTVLCHTLGGVLAFSIYSAIGVGVPDICRYCLVTTDSFVGTVSHINEDPWQSFLVLLETMDCIVHRRKPTRMIQIPDFVVDRRLGLCLPLLPYYQDLCVISNSLLNTTDVNIQVRLERQLEGIHAVVELWQPSHVDQLIGQFNSADIVNLLAQAKVYRLGALLIGHRLRYPFGCEDVQADIWSKEAMMEFEMAKCVTKRSPRFVTLPFIVAAVEVRDKGLRFKTLQNVDDCVDHYAPSLQSATKTFLSRVWHERDLNLTSRWFDSIHKPCPVLESINATYFGNSHILSN